MTKVTWKAKYLSLNMFIHPFYLTEMGIAEDFEIIQYNPYTATSQQRENYRKCVHPHNKVPAMITSEHEVKLTTISTTFN